MNIEDLDEMLASYVECALWSDSAQIKWDDETNSFVEDQDSDTSWLSHNFDMSDVDSDTLDAMKSDCKEFFEANEVDLKDITADMAGYDFWLTRHGHGAGFWDRGLGDVGERLTKACRPHGDFNLWLASDGKIHGE